VLYDAAFLVIGFLHEEAVVLDRRHLFSGARALTDGYAGMKKRT
jgi:phosphatidylserine/phosphatidylglycerophosphate/cardiolipin synthase-like enzyme